MTGKTVTCAILLNTGIALLILASNIKNGWGILLSFIGGAVLVQYTLLMRSK